MLSKYANKAFNFMKDTIWNFTHKDAAKMLIGMGALGFALSSLGQCFAIKINDKIDDKKKNFLLLQEAADGAINIGLFLAITSSIWKLSDKILKFSGIANYTKNKIPVVINSKTKGNIKSGGRIVTTMIASVLACNVVTPFVRNIVASKLHDKKVKKTENTQSVVYSVIKQDVNSPFRRFDNFALRGLPNMVFKEQKQYISASQVSGRIKI